METSNNSDVPTDKDIGLDLKVCKIEGELSDDATERVAGA